MLCGDGNNIVVVTPTGLWQNPVLQFARWLSALVADQKGHEHCICFPTKALTQDQLTTVDGFGLVPAAVYDGDTPDTGQGGPSVSRPG